MNKRTPKNTMHRMVLLTLIFPLLTLATAHAQSNGTYRVNGDLDVTGSATVTGNVTAASLTLNGVMLYDWPEQVTADEVLALITNQWPSLDVDDADDADNLGDHTATVDLDLANNQIINLAAPTKATDAATMQYVDGAVSNAVEQINFSNIGYHGDVSMGIYTNTPTGNE